MTYDHSSYWRTLHRTHPGSLRAVGHPWLSDALNELKYQSEASSLLGFLNAHHDLFSSEKSWRMLDVGAGTGFWTELLQAWLKKQGVTPRVTAVDLSEEALALVKERFPDVETMQADVSTIDPFRFRAAYNIVVSFYCLHHIPRIDGFLNGLRFAAQSLAPGGILLLMDPILTQPYSPFYSTVFSSHEGNGMPRPLAFIDDVVSRDGLERIFLSPAVSFLLNGPIEARSKLGSALTSRLWAWLQRAYRSQRVTQNLAGPLSWSDNFLKRHALAFSSSVVAYYRKR